MSLIFSNEFQDTEVALKGAMCETEHTYMGISLNATEETTDGCCHCCHCYKRTEFNFYPLPTLSLFQSFFLLPSYLSHGSK